MPKRIAIALIVASFAAAAQVSAASLTVGVTAIKEDTGAIMLALYDNADAYNGSGPSTKAARIDVEGGKVSIEFDDLPPGRYAIKLYHDANSTGELDTNIMGLPIEAYGFSGKAESLGPPPFDTAAVEIVAGENSVTVRLR